MSLPLIKKYDKKKNYMECPECKNGGDVYADGEGYIDLPLGFGFLPGETKFSLEKMRLKGYSGECMSCNKKVFNYVSRKAINTYPRSINNKLKNKRKVINDV